MGLFERKRYGPISYKMWPKTDTIHWAFINWCCRKTIALYGGGSTVNSP